MDLSNIDSLMNGLLKLFKVPKTRTPSIPSQLIIASAKRSGMNAGEIGAEIIRRRPEAGLPVGVLPNGDVNPDEMMEIIRAEVILDAINTQAKNTIAVLPGIKVVATGQTASGVPVIVEGVTVSIGKGHGIIE